MKVTVKWFSALRKGAPSGTQPLELPEGATAGDVLATIGEEAERTPGSGPALVILVNDTRAGMETPVKEGDKISILHVLGGGS